MDRAILDYYRLHASEILRQEAGLRPDYLELIANHLERGSSVLDVGCGIGRDVARMRELGFAAIGLDPSEKSLALGRRHYGLPEETLRRGALPELQGVGGPFDGLLCALVLQHLPDRALPASVGRMSRLLSERGVLLLTLPLEKPMDAGEIRYHLRSPEEYRLLCSRAGMEKGEEYDLIPEENSPGQSERVMLFRKTY